MPWNDFQVLSNIRLLLVVYNALSVISYISSVFHPHFSFFLLFTFLLLNIWKLQDCLVGILHFKNYNCPVVWMYGTFTTSRLLAVVFVLSWNCSGLLLLPQLDRSLLISLELFWETGNWQRFICLLDQSFVNLKKKYENLYCVGATNQNMIFVGLYGGGD